MERAIAALGRWQSTRLPVPDLQREARVGHRSRPDHNRALLQETNVCQLPATCKTGVNLSKKLDSQNLRFPSPAEAPTIGNLLNEPWKTQINFASRKYG